MLMGENSHVVTRELKQRLAESQAALPDDVRLGDLKDLNGYFPLKPCATPEQWAERSERVRRR